MEIGPAVVSAVFIILGGLQAARPDFVLSCQVWSTRVILGATFIPGPRTYRIVRSVGVAFVVFGLLVATQAIP